MQSWTQPVVVPRKQADGVLWRNWVLGSAAAGLLSGAITLGICGDAGFLLSGFVVAPLLGLIQARILRPYLPQLSGGVWALATTIGGALGWGLGFWTLGSILVYPTTQLPSVTDGATGTVNLGNALLVLVAMLVFSGVSGAIMGLGFGLGQRASINDEIALGGKGSNPARTWLLTNVGAWALAFMVVVLVFGPIYASLVLVPFGFVRLGSGLLWTLAVTIAGAMTGTTLQRLLQRTSP